MITDTGIVESIDRDAGTVTVQLLGEGERRPTIYPKYRGDPPPPLSYVDCAQIDSGLWRVDGAYSRRQLVFHDDFNHVGLSPNGGDTPWRLVANAAGSFAQVTATGDAVVRVVTGASSGDYHNFSKDQNSLVVPSDRALWLSARIATPDASSIRTHVGLGNDGTQDFSTVSGDYAAKISYNDALSPPFRLFTSDGSGSFAVIEIPYTVVNSTFFDIDIVLVGSEFAAAWVNGAGPYIDTSLVPTVGAGLQAFFGVFTDTAATREIWCDRIHLETVAPIAHPGRDLILPASGIVTDQATPSPGLPETLTEGLTG